MLLLESIRTCNRRLENLPAHNERMNRSRRELFGEAIPIDLHRAISIPDNLPPTLHKCRVLYGPDVQAIEFVPYFPKKIKTLETVICNDIEYTHKFADRSHLDTLLARSTADEIMIVKNGLLTDASYANLCFFDGEKWLTPATPLLAGTKRARLIAQGKISEAEIKPSDLRFFQKIALVNAMRTVVAGGNGKRAFV